MADRCEGIGGCAAASDAQSVDIPHDPNLPAGWETQDPGTRAFVIRGGTITGVSVPVKVSGSYAGDSETVVQVTFSVAPSGSMCETKGGTTSCGVAIWFGAHVAKSSQWDAYNGTTGAATIPGSPYHVALDAADGVAIGQRDNQMQSDTIVLPATKSGMKFDDLDADGVKDVGEPGLAGWTIYVDYDNDSVLDAGEPSAVTAAGGAYTINGITPGTWKVREVDQAGWTCSFPSPCYHEETFASGAALTGNDFGNYQNVGQKVVKYHDHNADGVKDGSGDEVLSGWEFFVDTNANEVWDSGRRLGQADDRRQRRGHLQRPGPRRVLLDLRGPAGRLVQHRPDRHHASASRPAPSSRAPRSARCTSATTRTSARRSSSTTTTTPTASRTAAAMRSSPAGSSSSTPTPTRSGTAGSTRPS